MNDVPRSLPGGDVENPHSIYIPEEDVTISLKAKGLMSGFETRITTQHNLNTCAHVFLTKKSRWDPIGSDIEQQEKNYEKSDRDDIGPRRIEGDRQIFEIHLQAEVSSVLSSVYNTLQDDYFLENIEDSVDNHTA